jgi:hypothetical protein
MDMKARSNAAVISGAGSRRLGERAVVQNERASMASYVEAICRTR